MVWPFEGWTKRLPPLQPGAAVVIFSLDPHAGVLARNMGMCLRDTFLILRATASEFAYLFRTPLSESTLAQNISLHGTGALNIDASRVRWKSEAERTAALPGSMPKANASIGTFQTRDRSSERPEEAQSDLGRWPANIVLVHGPRCRLVGQRRVEGHKGYPNGPGGSSAQFSQKGTKTTRTAAWAGHADADGLESVPDWECEPFCPCRRLDRQTSDLKPRSNKKPSLGGGGAFGHPKMDHPFVSYGDAGGASRFFPQFKNDEELLAWFRALICPPDLELFKLGTPSA